MKLSCNRTLPRSTYHAHEVVVLCLNHTKPCCTLVDDETHVYLQPSPSPVSDYGNSELSQGSVVMILLSVRLRIIAATRA
jgi:hypothetical protein